MRQLNTKQGKNVFSQMTYAISPNGNKRKITILIDIIDDKIDLIYSQNKLFEGEIIEKIIIPDVVNNRPILDISPYVFLQSQHTQSIANSYNPIKTVQISNNISSINSSAFKDTYINEIIWPKSCEYIPYNCFKDSQIKKILNTEKVGLVCVSAFNGCKKLTSINLPNCKRIEREAFICCKSLKEVIVPNTKFIEPEAFSYCGLEEFNWPEKCKVIPFACFSQNKSLAKININNVTNIEAKAFNGTAISEINLTRCINCNIHPDFAGSSIKIIVPFYQA